jgi:hypothetical protein
MARIEIESGKSVYGKKRRERETRETTTTMERERT